MFPYSPRTGTSAAKFKGQMRREEILKRGDELRGLSEKRYLSFLNQQMNKPVLSLVEKKPIGKNTYKALSRNYLPLTFESSQNVAEEEIFLTPVSVHGQALWARV